MILFIPVVCIAAIALVLFFLLRCLGVALPGNRHWTGWRRVVVAVSFACAASAKAF